MSADRLRDKVIVITGAGQGIGAAAAHRVASEGAHVVVADISGAGTARTHAELESMGARSLAVVVDLLAYDGAAELVAAALAEFGHIDVLVNNVGGATQFKPFHEWDPDELLAEVNLSLLPPLFCARAVVPHMIERRRGTIVNVGSDSVRNGLWDRLPYNVGKGGVHALTTSLARELGEFGITCNGVAPGSTPPKDRIVTRGDRDWSEAEEARRLELRKRTVGLTALGRSGTSDEQASAIAFLASDDASYMTGQILSVNGGSNMF